MTDCPLPARKPHYNPAVRVPLLLALSLALPGCVERTFVIRSEPEGARVRINGVLQGVTPLEIPFDHYGTVRLEAEPMDLDGDGFAEYAGVSTPPGTSGSPSTSSATTSGPGPSGSGGRPASSSGRPSTP
jgi:hypothetical protein